MKKLHKIITLALALIMILGIAAVPASAASDDKYAVWTEEEFWDLSNPRPEKGTRLFVLTKGDNFDWDKLNADYSKYAGEQNYATPTNSYSGSINIFAGVEAAAREAYNRISDPEYKALIVEVFELKVSNTGTTTPPATSTAKPETPVTQPVTTPTAPTATVTSFSDVKPGAWYYDAVTEFAKSGLVTGYVYSPRSSLLGVASLSPLSVCMASLSRSAGTFT